MTLEALMPDWLLYMGPGGLALWQWLGLALVILVGYLVGRAGAWLFTWIGAKVVGRTNTSLDDELLARLRSPLRALAWLGCIRLGMVTLALHLVAEYVVHRSLL